MASSAPQPAAATALPPAGPAVAPPESGNAARPIVAPTVVVSGSGQAPAFIVPVAPASTGQPALAAPRILGAAPPGHAAGADVEARRREVLAILDTFGALADPGLLEDLAGATDGPVRLQAVLAGLQEVPFHLDRALWAGLEASAREAAVPAAPAPTVSAEAGRARKEAMRRNAAKVYDGRVSAEAAGEGMGEPGGASGENGGEAGQDGSGAEADPDQDDAVEKGDHDEAGPRDAKAAAKAFRVETRSDWQPLAALHKARLEVTADMTGNSTCEGTTQDFKTYFQDRYRQLAKILRARRELRNATPIERVRPGAQEVQVIGMVLDTMTAKSGNRVIELEDETGTIRALVRQEERALHSLSETLVADEVVGVVGAASQKGDMLFVESLVRPDIPMRERDREHIPDVPLAAAFLSDIHVGSGTFMSENWAAMLKWLNGHGASKRERDAAGRIKYLVIPGDLVDGVGVYPGQQHELTIEDIYDQYAAFGHWIDAVPKHVQVIVQPGNHDAARPAEPQPAFSPEVRTRFDRHEASFISNPATFKMHGVTTLGYHGFSLIDMATSVANLEYEKPIPTMKQLLQSRHLAPLYGERTPVAPEHKDYLVISDVPDLFVTGHVHVPGIDSYRGVQMVNCGTWQSQTLYQKMLNFTPDPCRMPYFDLQSLRGTLVDFQTAQTAGAMA